MEPQSMQTEVWRVAAEAPDAEIIEEAAQILRDGGLVAFPTETVYGLGADALNAEAVARIFVAKGRPAVNPIIVHVPDAEAAQEIVSGWSDRAERLAAAFWPGPLTLILPRRPQVPDVVTAGGATVGVRVPAHAVARALLEAAGVPIAAPSANLSNQLSPTRARHVLEGLNGRIDAILDGGPTSGGLESTVLDLTSKYPLLLRPGLITPAAIEEVVGPIKRRAAHTAPTPTVSVDASGNATHNEAPLRSPGLLARHYAPRATLELSIIGLNRVKALLAQGMRVGWLTFNASAAENVRTTLRGAVVITMPSIPEIYAAKLYDDLHTLDEARVDYIIVDRPPQNETWLGITDRLNRAATK